MFKISFLRNIFLLSLALACGLPLYDYLYIYPSYDKLLVAQTEREASRFVRFLVATKDLETIDLETIPSSSWGTREINRMKEDALLVKLRIFSSGGRIVYSTHPSEIGHLNNNEYFHEQVAKGMIYSKVVHHDHSTAAGDRLRQDVVETYVPIMADGRFHGAVEIYYDITRELEKLSALNLHSGSLLVIFALAFLISMLFGLRRARLNYLALQKAEADLQGVNETLEFRVAERTGQLQKTNYRLTGEIEERVKAEKALQDALETVSDAHDKIDTILASVADGLIVTDDRGRVVLMNRVAEEIFSVSNWMPGMPLEAIINNPEMLGKVALAEARLSDGHSAEFDLDLTGAIDADRQVFSARASFLRSADGKKRGVVLLLQDVTKVRNIERMKSEFVSMAAHELRTPLTMILGYAELLMEKRKFTAAEKSEFLGVIRDKAVALSAIVDDLLDVSRIEEGRPLELSRENTDLRQLVDVAVAEARLRKEFRHEIVVQSPENRIYLPADKGRLLQVLQNLLSNAIKYSPNGGKIVLRIGEESDWVEMSISDQGIGMTPTQVELAFDRFYRADTSDAGIRGTGLGLSIVRYIVEAHGGQIRIESQLHQGTMVRCLFPAKRNQP